MNKQTEALKMAIDWFEVEKGIAPTSDFDYIIKACKEALAEAEKQEWQSLSDDEIEKIQLANGGFYKSVSFARAIEQALKEKNT
jgi:hypothetical protein